MIHGGEGGIPSPPSFHSTSQAGRPHYPSLCSLFFRWKHSGWLRIPKDIKKLAEAIDKVEYLLRNPSYAREMGEAGRKVVKDKFLITRHLRDYLRLIGELCG